LYHHFCKETQTESQTTKRQGKRYFGMKACDKLNYSTPWPILKDSDKLHARANLIGPTFANDLGHFQFLKLLKNKFFTSSVNDRY